MSCRTAFCGGGFNSNPIASLYDGQIDSIAVKNIGRIKFVSLVGDYKKGRHLGDKFKKVISHFKCKSVELHFDERTPISVDGEVVWVDDLNLSIERGALGFLVPAGVRPTSEVTQREAVTQ